MEDNGLISSILGGQYYNVVISRVSITDDLDGHCDVVVSLTENVRIEGSGFGAVDAMFAAFKQHFAKDNQSLNSIELADFSVTLLNKSVRGQIPGTGTRCRVSLVLKNSWGTKFDFVSSSNSITAASASAVALGIQHFINSERAYLTLYKAWKDAQDRNRQDLADKYLSQMAEVVKSTSYTELVANIRESLP